MPLPFVAGADSTLDYVGNRKVHIAQGQDGWKKRQDSIQLCMAAGAFAKQPSAR